MQRMSILALLALSACGGPSLSENQSNEVRDIADDISGANDSDLEAKIEAKIDDLDSRLLELESQR